MPLRILASVLPRANPSAEGTEELPASSSIPRTFIDNTNNTAFSTSLINGIHSSSHQPSLLATFKGPPILSTDLFYGHPRGGGRRKTIEEKERVNQGFANVANWLSLIGSLLIILHIPGVTRHVPSQKKRMLIILFTAFSNTGFAIANIVTGTFFYLVFIVETRASSRKHLHTEKGYMNERTKSDFKNSQGQKRTV